MGDPYVGLVTLTDVNAVIRGWDGPSMRPMPEVSRGRISDIIPSSTTILPSASITLSQRPSEIAQSLPPGVVLRITGNSILSAAFKFAGAFTSPIPWGIERGSLLCCLHKDVPNMELQIQVSHTDVSGEVSPQFTPETEYAMKIPSSSASSKVAQRFDFKNDGSIELHTAASTVIIHAPSIISTRHVSKERVQNIISHPVIAAIGVRAASLKAVFPLKQVRGERDRTISISPRGVEISGTVEENLVSATFLCNRDSPDYHFITPPTRLFYAKLTMDGLSKIGQCISSGSATEIEIAFYEKTQETYYMRIQVRFSPLSSGAAFIQILETGSPSTATTATTTAMPAISPRTSEPTIVERTPPSASIGMEEEEEEEEDSTYDIQIGQETRSIPSASAFDDGGGDYEEVEVEEEEEESGEDK